MALFIEENIVNSVKSLLLERVNELLGEMDCPAPPIEFGQSGYTGLSAMYGGFAVVPVVGIAGCERSEKERIVRLDVYSVTVGFAVPENGDSELLCYAYSAAVDRALAEDPALGGVVDRAVLTGKKYIPPKHDHCGEGWEVVLTLRISVEQGAGSR
jgi:hypothetical protein